MFSLFIPPLSLKKKEAGRQNRAGRHAARRPPSVPPPPRCLDRAAKEEEEGKARPGQARRFGGKVCGPKRRTRRTHSSLPRPPL